LDHQYLSCRSSGRRQRLQDSAFTYSPTAALPDDASELGLQPGEIGDFLLYIGEMVPGQFVDIVAIVVLLEFHPKQLSDLFYGKAKSAASAHE
jgi:hypothetical protein